jgi:hypothetical protein
MALERNRTTYFLSAIVLILLAAIAVLAPHPTQPDRSHLEGLTHQEICALDPKLVPQRELVGCLYEDLKAGRLQKIWNSLR